MAATPSNSVPTPPWIAHLERAHGLVHEAAFIVSNVLEPNEHLAPAARKLEAGVCALYDAIDGRRDGPTAVGMASARFWDAAALVARAGFPNALGALRLACAELTQAERAFRPQPPRSTPPFRAGRDLPRLHQVERSSLSPLLRAPPLPPSPPPSPAPFYVPPVTTFEQLADVVAKAQRLALELRPAITSPARQLVAPAAPAEPPRGYARVPERAETRTAFVNRWARECFDEVGMLGLQRAPMLGDDWRACEPLERRLVAAVDAFIALGDAALDFMEPYALDAPVPDPMRMFAITMIGGCLEGRDGLGAAERVLHRFGIGTRAVSDAFVAALKLVPNPAAAHVARNLFLAPGVASRAAGLEVLGDRAWLTAAELDALGGETEPRLLRIALPLLGAMRHRTLDRLLLHGLDHEDGAVHLAALDALALGARTNAAEAARNAVHGSLGDDALLRLAIVGDADDASSIVERLRAQPSTNTIAAAGWAGHLNAVPLLIELLEAGDDDIALTAGEALDRLLGGNLLEEIEVAPEALDDAPVPDQGSHRGQTLDELVSDPRDRPPSGSPDLLEVPSTDPDLWRSTWTAHRQHLDTSKRTRRGRPYTPSSSLWELDKLHLTAEERRHAHRELVTTTGRSSRFSPHDFVVVQERCIRDWARLLASSQHAAGSWPKARR